MKIVCEREGKRVTFAHALPYWLKSVEGLGELDVDVEGEKPTGQDGELYLGATANKRNIVIKATVVPPDNKTHAEIREEFFAFFVPRESGVLYLYDGAAAAKKIEYKTENCEFEMDGQFRVVTISLLCHDPTFKGVEDEIAPMAEITGLIEWPMELEAEFEVGIKDSTLMATVVNSSSVTRGMTITFKASGEVVNPGLVEVSRQESMRINTTMHAGDVIVVTTGLGNKRLKLTRGTEETEINNLWEFGGTWLQVEPGKNVYRYTADSGTDVLEVILASTPAYWGA